MSDTDLLTTRELCEAAGITYRQADYWTRQGYLSAVNANGGQGSRRVHRRTEVLVATGLAQLLRAGCCAAATVAESLRSLPPGWTAPVLLDGDGSLTTDLDVARWVVHPDPDLAPA